MDPDRSADDAVRKILDRFDFNRPLSLK